MSAFSNWFVLQDEPTGGQAPISGPWRPPQWQSQKQLYSLTFTPASTTGSQSQSKTLFFDAIMRATYRSTSRFTEHPVQSGASLVDHIYELPDYFTMEIGMSDAQQSFVAGQYTSNTSKSVSCYQQLRDLKRQRVPITVTTKLYQFLNMQIEELSAEDTFRTFLGLKAFIVFRQIILATVVVNTISARPDQSNQTSEGTKPTENVPPGLQSLLDSTSQFPQPQWNSNNK